MKTQINFLKVALIGGLIFATSLASSNTSPASGNVSTETEKTIRAYFKFPQILMPHYENENALIHSNKVEVLFTTDKNGKVNFVLAKTSNQQLKREIEQEFSKLNLVQLKQNVVHSVLLNFKTL